MLEKNSVDYKFSKEDLDHLLTSSAVRSKAQKVYQLALSGKTHFQVNEEKLKEVSDFVLSVMRENYPDLNIPFHSRWGHFNTAKKNRIEELNSKLAKFSDEEKCRRKLDLVITSVLLDAGAGDRWSFYDESTEEKVDRSEGLALASLNLFLSGSMSIDPLNDPLRVDGEKLISLSIDELEKAFQVSETNPLVAVSGRLELMQSLGKTLLKRKEIFKDARPGNIYDYYLDSNNQEELSAELILKGVLIGLGDIWPGRINLGGVNLGDVWHYSHLANGNSTNCLIPFHKLSQWLTYSLIEPLMEAGLKISCVEKLTGLAEYRNGGLFIDMSVLELRQPELLDLEHGPDSDLIIEWRALTVSLLDQVATMIRKELKLSEVDFPLPKILEGGTWWAGRKVAQKLRPEGGPPIKIKSDGTVF